MSIWIWLLLGFGLVLAASDAVYWKARSSGISFRVKSTVRWYYWKVYNWAWRSKIGRKVCRHKDAQWTGSGEYHLRENWHTKRCMRCYKTLEKKYGDIM